MPGREGAIAYCGILRKGCCVVGFARGDFSLGEFAPDSLLQGVCRSEFAAGARFRALA